MPSNLELIAVAFGIANITLLIRRSIWNFPFGIVMVALYFEIFREARLYSDMGLQVFFAVVQAWGWWAWARSGGMAGPVEVNRLGNAERAGWIAAVVVATVLWGWLMATTTNAVAPWWDAAVAMGSVASQILLARRAIENWIGWIVVDVLAIGLYASRGLTLTAGLYGLFLILAIVGWLEWRKAAVTQHSRADVFA
jgi:nicotinamide mononucleotide transporter